MGNGIKQNQGTKIHLIPAQEFISFLTETDIHVLSAFLQRKQKILEYCKNVIDYCICEI